mmetsp:Transcript_23487/g.61884  ORF Transcript_23487/g.61884 Transcript_23487/m.61884 type:complete len:336 (+) Transcript_23487:192-1199(+)
MIGCCLRALCPWAQDYLHPREITLLCATFLTFAALLVATMSMPDEKTDDLYHWRHRLWNEAMCAVHETGITYLGDCDMLLNQTETLKMEHLAPSYSYSDCIEEDLPESCIDTVSEAFHEGRRLSPAAGPRRLKKRAHADLCEDVFSTWALVRVKHNENLQYCAYTTGLLSQSSVRDFNEATSERKKWPVGNYIPCWFLKLKSAHFGSDVDECPVVALEDPNTWQQSSQQWLEAQDNLKKLMMFLALVFGIGAAASMAFYERCWGVQRWGDLGDAVNDEDLDEEPPESERIRFVRDRWRLFRANVLAEYTLVNSARDIDVSSVTSVAGASNGGPFR